MTIYTDRYKRAKELMEELEDTFSAQGKECKAVRTNNINNGANFVKNTLKDAVSHSSSALAICNRLLMHIRKQIQDDPKLRDRLFDPADLPIDYTQEKVASALESVSLLDSYIIERIELSVEYTKLIYDSDFLDGSI